MFKDFIQKIRHLNDDETTNNLNNNKLKLTPLNVNNKIISAMDSELNSQNYKIPLQFKTEYSPISYMEITEYLQDPLIRACIDTVCDDICKKNIEIISTDENIATDIDKIKQLNIKLKELNIFSIIKKAVSLTLYYGGCLILIKDENNDYSFPISYKNTNITSLKILDPFTVFPVEYQTVDPTRNNYYIPNYWYCYNNKIHNDRVIQFKLNNLPTILLPLYNFFGISKTQLLIPYVNAYKNNNNNMNKLLSKFTQLVFKTNMEDVISATNIDGFNNFNARMKFLSKFRNNDSVCVIDKENEDIDNVETSLSGVKDAVQLSLETIACINRTPAVKILGQTPSGLTNGSADLENYYDYISTEQQNILYNPLIKLLHIIEESLFGEIDPTIDIKFPSLNEINKSTELENDGKLIDNILKLKENNLLSTDDTIKLMKKNINFVE